MAYKISPAQANRPQNELFVRLSLHHNYKKFINQADIVNPKLPNNFGNTVVNDWTLFGPDSDDTKLIARAVGMHIQAGQTNSIWQNYFSIVFEDERFHGSSLQVMGPVVETGEWAIVGGTGEFALAQGVIKKTLRQFNSNGDIVDLDIHAFYTSPTVWTLGP